MENDISLATEAALAAGQLLRMNFGKSLVVDEALHHDIKLALDKESQDLITKILLGARPTDALYGEEGIAGNQESGRQWIVDPIDGTVNFFYGIPHFCISIALRVDDEVVLGVIHDPMVGETWTIEKGGVPLLNGEPVKVSSREKLEESILFVGCGKSTAALTTGIERFRSASLRARKMRMMGSAALGMAYICCGRWMRTSNPPSRSGTLPPGNSLVEAAGGKVTLTQKEGKADAWSIVATNGKIPIEEVL